MKYRKGLALLLAAALTMSIAPQTGSLASASEVPSVQESVPESGAADSDAVIGTDSEAAESGAADSDAAIGTDSEAPESGAADSDAAIGTDSEAAESGTADSDAAAGTDSEAAESGAAGSDAAAGTDSEAAESGAAGSDAAIGTDSEAAESGAAGFGSEAGETDAAAPVPGDSLSGEGSEGEVSVPDEKQDADGVPGDDEGISPMSLLPLKEVDARLELYEADHSKVPVGTILQRMRDTEGNLISVDPESEITLACSGDDYRSYGRDETVDLSGLTGEEPEIRLIVGKGTQLDAEAVRYIVKVRFYAASATESLTYTVLYYKDSSDTVGSSVGNSNYNEYGRIEGLDVPVTLVRYAGRKEDMAAGEFGLSIRSSIDPTDNYGGRVFGNDIQVSVYQMKTFLDAYNREEKTIREDAPKEAILGSGSFRRGAYGELNQENLIESDNLFCIVYTDTVTGKVVEYQGLAFIISSQEELFLKGNLYEEVDKEPICENLGGKLYTGISWYVNVSGEPGKGEVNYDQQHPSVELPAGYPADKTYPYIIQNTDGMIKKVEVSDSGDSWGGTDITSDVLASGNTIPKGYGVKCGSPAYFTVYTAGGMVLRYRVSIRAAAGSSTYSYTYQVSKEPNGAKEACIVGYGPDAVYEGTGIHVTPVMIYPKNTEGFDPKASYYLSMQYSGGANNKVAVYKMEDFLKCYDAGSGNVSGLDEGKAVTGQILGQNAVGYEVKNAESGSSDPNVFAIVYTSPYDGKVLGYHAISVQLAAKALAVEGGFYTDVDGKRTKVSSTSSTSFYSGYVGYSVHSGDEYKAIEGSYSFGTISIYESLYEGYPYRQGDFFYIMEKNPDITKVEAGSGSQREDVTDKIFTEGYPAYDFQVTLGDGTEWKYEISRSGGRQNVIDKRYTYRVYAAGETPENQSTLSLRKSEYTSYIPPEETELPVDVTQVILYLDPDKCGEGQEYGLSIQGGGTSQLNSSNSQITREVYRMKDFLAYYQAKVGGTDAELEGKIDDILYQSGSANGHRGSYAAPSEGTDPTEADNMFCIVYRHKETREIMACQGLLIQIRPYIFDVKGRLYTVENGMSNPLPENAVTPSYNSPTQSNSASYGVVGTTGTAVSRYQSKGTYTNSVQSVTYRYTMSQGYGADKYAYVMEVPGGDREKVRIFLGRYNSIEEAEAAGTENDITDAILPKDEASKPYGYVADYRDGVVVTAFVGADQVMQYSINVISNDQQVNWQYYIYARAAEGSGFSRVFDTDISKKVYIPYPLEGVDNIPVTKVMYYVSGENYKDAAAWSLRMSGSVSNIDTKVYRMKDYLEKKDDPETLEEVEIQNTINSGTGHEGNYEDPGADVLKADNLFCIVYTNKQTGEVVSRQGVLFVIHNQVSAPQAGGSIYQKEEGGALKELKEGDDYKLDFSAPAHDTSRPTWVIGGASSSYPKADSVSYTYTWASEESDIGEYRYVLDKNDDIDMVAEGAYETAEAAKKEGKDITESILCKTEELPEGYVLRHGEGSESTPVTNPFTVVFKDGSVLKITVTVQIQIIPSSSADDQAPHEYRKPKTYGDPYFRVTGAVAYTGDTNYVYQSGTQQGRQTVFPAEDGYVEKPGQVYVVRNSENTTLDASYNYGYQTVFIADENADLTKIAPIFELGEGNNSNNVKAYVGRMQESGAENSAHDFSKKSVLYNVFIGSSLRNYSVTFVKKTTGGANLFVNGPSTREVFLTETRERSHDILIANLGDAALTDLKVELRDAEHVKLDDYWTVGGSHNKELKAFDGAVSGSAYGELQNLAKIRLLPAGGDGEVKGTLIISGKDAKSGKEITKEITLTGLALNPEITTLSLDDAVKFVPYSYVIGTNNMHYEWNRVKFSVVEEPGADKWHKLPDGLELDEDTGEIYGLPQEDTPGEYHIKVKAEYSRTDLFEPSEAEFDLLVLENEDQIVYEQSDSVASGAENDYTIMTPVGSDMGGYRFDVTEIRDWNFDSHGPFPEFMDLYLNGEKLIEGTDYTANSGSTKIVVLSQTFEKARGENERNTLAAEFRVNGERMKSEVEVNTLYRTAQNFYLNLSDEEDPGESPAPTEEPGTETPEPGITTPEPGTETPEPGTRPTATPEPGTRPTVTPEPGTRPTATPNPGTRPTATPNPGTRPTATPEPGTRPTATPEPGTRPTATPNPGTRPTATPGSGTRPTATPGSGTRPTATPNPGTRPTATPNPGTRPTATPNPGNRPDSTAVPAPGGRPGTTSAPGGQPGANPAPGGQGGTNPVPGGQPGTNPVPGGQGGTNPAPGGQPGTNPVPGGQGGTNPAPGGQPGTNQTPDGQEETQPGTESATGGQDAAASAPESPSDAGSSTEGGADNENTATIIARMADPEGNPYVGYTMEIHSEPKSAVLDQSGTAVFADIEGGSHVMYVKDPKGNTAATKEFVLAVGDTVSLAGSQIAVKAGETYTLSIRLEDDRLDFLSLEEGDTRNGQLSKARSGMNPFFWVVIAALFLGVCGSGAWVYMKGKKPDKKNR